MANNTKKPKGNYGKPNIDYEDKDYKISLEALLRLLKTYVKEGDLILSSTTDKNHLFIDCENADSELSGGGFYDLKNRVAFNLTSNWADLIDDIMCTNTNTLFAENLYNKDKYKDLDLMTEEDWNSAIG